MLCSGVAGACRLAHARGDQQPSLSLTDTEESSAGIAAVPVTAHLIPVDVAVCLYLGPGGDLSATHSLCMMYVQVESETHNQETHNQETQTCAEPKSSSQDAACPPTLRSPLLNPVVFSQSHAA